MYSHREQGRPKWFAYLPLAALLLLAAGIVLGVGISGKLLPLASLRPAEGGTFVPSSTSTVEEVLRYVDAKYVDPVNREDLEDAAVAALLNELDPYSSYVPPTAAEEHRARIEGTALGLGVDIVLIQDSVTVVAVLPGSAAAQAGVEVYDRILSVGDSMVSGRGLRAAAVERLVETFDDEQVPLQLLRRGTASPLRVSLRRGEVKLPSVDEGVLLEPKVAYVRIAQFTADTYQEFMRQLERLSGEGAQHLILDLRGNSGGYLSEAVSLLSQLFVEDGKLLVYTEGANSKRKEYKTTGRVFFPIDRVAVLIDGGSASASEIIAGAIQDWDRGEIIGQPSFGKGMVQELYTLREGGALHLTISRYYTPSGRSIQRRYDEASLQQETPAEDLLFSTAGGREVYAHGGIQPDREVARGALVKHQLPQSWARAASTFAWQELEVLSDTLTAAGLAQQFQAFAKTSLVGYTQVDWERYRVKVQEEMASRLLARREGVAVGIRTRLAKDAFVQAGLASILDQRPLAKR